MSGSYKDVTVILVKTEPISNANKGPFSSNFYPFVCKIPES